MAARAALVTGGSSGIGLAIARALGQDGYSLTLSARRPEKLEGAVEQLRDEGLEVEDVPANMAKEEEVIGLVDRHRVLRWDGDLHVMGHGDPFAQGAGDRLGRTAPGGLWCGPCRS